jgi:hypothetical protein
MPANVGASSFSRSAFMSLMDDRDLPGRRLNDLEGIGRGQHARQPVRDAEFSRGIGNRPVFQTRHILFLRSLAASRQRQVAATDELNFGMVLGCPIGFGISGV